MDRRAADLWDEPQVICLLALLELLKLMYQAIAMDRPCKIAADPHTMDHWTASSPVEE